MAKDKILEAGKIRGSSLCVAVLELCAPAGLGSTLSCPGLADQPYYYPVLPRPTRPTLLQLPSPAQAHNYLSRLNLSFFLPYGLYICLEMYMKLNTLCFPGLNYQPRHTTTRARPTLTSRSAILVLCTHVSLKCPTISISNSHVVVIIQLLKYHQQSHSILPLTFILKDIL